MDRPSSEGRHNGKPCEASRDAPPRFAPRRRARLGIVAALSKCPVHSIPSRGTRAVTRRDTLIRMPVLDVGWINHLPSASQIGLHVKNAAFTPLGRSAGADSQTTHCRMGFIRPRRSGPSRHRGSCLLQIPFPVESNCAMGRLCSCRERRNRPRIPDQVRLSAVEFGIIAGASTEAEQRRTRNGERESNAHCSRAACREVDRLESGRNAKSSALAKRRKKQA